MTKLDEYFDRARRETPPLQKDEVSNILREKLSERPDRETAHTRGNGVWWRSIGRVFLTLPLKGWIMISALLTSTILATVLLWQTPTSIDKPFKHDTAQKSIQAPPQARTKQRQVSVASAPMAQKTTTILHQTDNSVTTETVSARDLLTPIYSTPNMIDKSKTLVLSDVELQQLKVVQLEDGTLEASGNSFGEDGFLKIRIDMYKRMLLVDMLKNPAFSHYGDQAFKQIFEFFPPEQVKKMKVEHAEFVIDSASALQLELQAIPLPRLMSDNYGTKYYFNRKDFAGDSKITKEFIKQLVAQQSKTAEQAAADVAELNKLENKAKKVFKELDKFEQEKSDISKLIGIRIPSKQARAEGDEYLLWYDPTPEFIALLPERYRTGLEREVAAAKKYATKCEIPTEEERKAIPGYFDSWRSCDGMLKIASIFPNPADVKATVRFTLAEARSVTITVHNLNGDRLAILEATPMLPAGEHELPLDFTGRNVGVYLLALSTDKNETAIKRVIISR